MQMNKESSWLFDKASKEDGAQVSVGGLIGDIEAMGKGLAEKTEQSPGVIPPFKLHGVQIYTWPSDYGFYRPQFKPIKEDPLDSPALMKALQAAQEQALKKKEAEIAKQLKKADDYLDPEVDKLEKKLRDIQSKIETKRKQNQKAAKIKELNDLIAKAESELAAL